MPELPPQDPVTERPMAGLVLISVFILMLTVAWSLYDEFFGLRPWRKYQSEFSSAYSNYLDKQYKQRKADEQKFYATPEYTKMVADVKAATDAARGKDEEIGQQIGYLPGGAHRTRFHLPDKGRRAAHFPAEGTLSEVQGFAAPAQPRTE